MNKLFVIIGAMFLVLGSVAMAKTISIGQADIFNNNGMTGVMQISNTGGSALKNLHATMYVMDTDAFGSTSGFRLAGHSSTVKYVLFDSGDVAKGDYYVRVSVGNNEARKVVYRLITIQ